MKKIYEKYKNISVTIKASIWYTICNVIQKSISFLTVPIFTVMLTTEEYGQFSIYQSWLNIIIIFVTLCLYGGVFNNAMMKYEKDRDGFISSMQGLVFVLCVGWFIIYYVNKDFWNGIFELPTYIIVVMFVEMAVRPALEFWSGKQRYEYKYQKFVFVTLLLAIVNPVVGIFIVKFAQEKGYARIVSNAVVVVGISGILYLYNFIRGKKFFDKKYWQYALKFNIPLIPYYISQMLFTQSDRIMIGKMVNQSKAGIYSLTLNCSMVVSFVLNAIEASYIPWLYGSIQKKNYKNIRKVGNELLSLVGVALLGMTMIGPEVIDIMAPPEYLEAIWAVPPVVGGLLFLFEAKLFVGIEFYYENKKGLVYASILSAVTNIILNYIWIPKFGFVIAGYTTLIAYILFALMNYISMKKTVIKNISDENINNLYDSKYILRFSIIYIILSGSIMLLYPYRIIRLFIIFVIVVLLVLNYRKILKGIKRLKDREDAK